MVYLVRQREQIKGTINLASIIIYLHAVVTKVVSGRLPLSSLREKYIHFCNNSYRKQEFETKQMYIFN